MKRKSRKQSNQIKIKVEGCAPTPSMLTKDIYAHFMTKSLTNGV